MTIISLVQTNDRIEGVRKAISLLATNPVKGKTVVLKPNFNTADPFPGSTHNDTLRGIVKTFQAMGAKKIVLAERSGPREPTCQVMEKKGIFELATELNIEIVNLQELGAEGWVHLRPENSHWPDGFHFPRLYHESECIVQTCCLKTHAHGGHFTLSLKNSVGLVPRDGYPYMEQLHTSTYQRDMIAEINTAYAPAMIVLDGLKAFVDGGPGKGTLASPGVIIAGSDRIAIDATGVAVLRLLGTTEEVSRGPIFKQDQIARAVALGLGVTGPEQINIITGDVESENFAGMVRPILKNNSK